MNKNSIYLTETEGKIMLLLLDGRAPRFICHEQSISEDTFRVHLRNMKKKVQKGWNSKPVKAEETPHIPTQMQLKVLERRAARKNHFEIADELGISYLTSYAHASAGMKRMGVIHRNGYDMGPLRKALAALAESAESTPSPMEEKQ
jgi:DNA-binding CsgD family transcriptional regulator